MVLTFALSPTSDTGIAFCGTTDKTLYVRPQPHHYKIILDKL